MTRVQFLSQTAKRAQWRHNIVRVFGVSMFILSLGSWRLSATDYFVRANGDDNASGLSTATAWRSIERANHARFQPGDRLRFEAGSSFIGNLWLSEEEAGTSNQPVVVGSFGEGRATILAGRDTGITVENAGGVAIENLIVEGAGRTNNNGYGICCENTLTNGTRLNGLRLENVEARGFGVFGILVTGNESGYEHVLITRCAMHDNLRGGMEVAGRLPWDATSYAHSDVRVEHCEAFNNTGDPDYLRNHSGSGIVLYEVDGGVMEDCAAWNNGALCRSSGGGVGLWTCASRNVVIQHCESFHNKTSGRDGGGFDIDGGSLDCVLQYNYSHDNDGPGLLVCTYPFASHTDHGAVVRFNISENDSRKSRTYAGLWVRAEGKEITGLEIYNNTIMIGPWSDQAAFIDAHDVAAQVCNNIFVSAGAAVPLRVEHPQDRVRFENNLYWREGGLTEICWGQETFTNLPEWRAGAGQELLNGKPTGIFADPVLSRHGPDEHASERCDLHAVRAFRPQRSSPALVGGLDLRQKFEMTTGALDFLGTLPPAGQFPLGAMAAPSPY